MDRIVLWDDFDDMGFPIIARAPASICILRQKVVAKAFGFEYDDDELALYDFMVVNWAWYEDEDKR